MKFHVIYRQVSGTAQSPVRIIDSALAERSVE